MKKLYLFLSVLALSSQLQAKPVDVTTAKLVGFNFLSSKLNSDALKKADDLQLVYTAASAAQSANYYYVFNAGNTGFVMVSADDQVTPVFGYSNEGAFDPNNIPPAAVVWYKNYADQIQYVIEHNLTGTSETAAEWKTLLSGKSTSANKTTAVNPLVATKWDQDPIYNQLCPSNSWGQAVTGCVATAMAQIMKYWNYPAQGKGNHSYFHPDYGNLSASFNTTTYQWSSMPNALTTGSTAAAKTAVATLMYHAGVSVDMQYGPGSSGGSAAYVQGPGGPSAEHALVNFFNYDPGLTTEFRNNYSEAQWIAILQAELDANRPVLYAGFTTSSSGHAWVADGYDNFSPARFHINWGWGGYSDGYFFVGDMTPPGLGTGGGSGGGFNLNQMAIVGIQPPSTVPADVYESNNDVANAKKLPSPSFSNHKGGVSLNASIHNSIDEDYYEIPMPATNHKYRVTARVQDKKFANNGKTYTADVKGAGSTSKLSLNTFFDTTMATPLTVNGGTSAYFRVAAFTKGASGTYLLDVTVTDITTGVAETATVGDVSVYPNPASDMLHIALNGTEASEVSLTDIQGRVIRKMAVENKATVDMNLDNVASGTYFVRIATETAVVTKKISIAK